MRQDDDPEGTPGPSPAGSPGDPPASSPAGPPAEVTRRGFLSGAGIVAGAAALGAALPDPSGPAPAAPRAESGPAVRTWEVLGPGNAALILRVNGKVAQVLAEPRATLLDALRGHLELTGTKEVCDRGSCGACTVLLDGRPVYACMILAADARGREITTVEGLASAGGALHPVQQAFVEKDGLQCGFCTPGQVVAAAALLAEHPHPTDEEIRAGMCGNLCRCGAYPKIFEAVREASKKMAPGKGRA